MLRRTFTCLLAVLAVMLSTTVSAAAETITFADPRGDAPARYDLTRTSITNGDNRLVVVQRVKNLRGGRAQIYGFSAATGVGVTNVHVVRRKNGTIATTVLGPDSTVRCDGVRVRWRLGEDSIRVSMPRVCVAGRGAVRVSTMIGAGNGTAGDPADVTRTVRVARG